MRRCAGDVKPGLRGFLAFFRDEARPGGGLEVLVKFKRRQTSVKEEK